MFDGVRYHSESLVLCDALEGWLVIFIQENKLLYEKISYVVDQSYNRAHEQKFWIVLVSWFIRQYTEQRIQVAETLIGKREKIDNVLSICPPAEQIFSIPPATHQFSLCLPFLPEADALLQFDFLHSFLYAHFPSLQYLCFLQICDGWAAFTKCFPCLSWKPGFTYYNI